MISSESLSDAPDNVFAEASKTTLNSVVEDASFTTLCVGSSNV